MPAGQSTQMIIGATGESDYQILSVTEALYQRFDLKRVFYSAFVNVNNDSTLAIALFRTTPIFFSALKSSLPVFLAFTILPADFTPMPGTRSRVLYGAVFISTGKYSICPSEWFK